MTYKKGKLMLAASLLYAVSSANAGLIKFDFSGAGPFANSGNNQTTFDYSLDGVNLSVAAYETPDSLATINAADIRNGGNGLGVEGNGSTKVNNPGGFPSIIEWLGFSTDTGNIVSVGIWNLNNGEETDFWSALDANGNGFSFLSTLSGTNPINPQYQSVDPQSEPWLLVSTGTPESSFRVHSVTVDVPEPSTIGLLVLGLLGLGYTRHRKS